MAEAYLKALTQIHDELAIALVSYVDDIEKQLIEKEVLSRYQAECLHKQTNSKLKIQYILKDCIQFQLNKRNDSQFQVLRDFLRTASNSDSNLVPLVVCIDLEEKPVPVKPSHQVTEEDSQSQQATDDGESGIGMLQYIHVGVYYFYLFFVNCGDFLAWLIYLLAI